MNTSIDWIRGPFLALALVSTTGFASDKRFDFDFTAGAGAKYDTNVAIVELDNSAGEPDTVATFEAALGMKARLGDSVTLDLGYDYSGTRYREFSEFDLDLHHGHASLSFRSGAWDSALTFDYFDGVLAGEDYLAQTLISPSISRLFGTRWYLRGAYTRSDKTFSTFGERSAVADALRVDAYLLLDGMSHYFALSAQALAEDAYSTEYDYDSTMAQLAWGYRFDAARNPIKLKTALRYEQRNYNAVILEAGGHRVDDRLRARLAATIPFSEHVSLGASVEVTHNTSGLAEANLDRTVYAMEFGVSF